MSSTYTQYEFNVSSSLRNMSKRTRKLAVNFRSTW
nr:MAG TPA: hypothetical protein [Caudoviricetes sp.]